MLLQNPELMNSHENCQGFTFFFDWWAEVTHGANQMVVGHFLKLWVQAYQTKHSWHLGSILYLRTDTCMHICIIHIDCWLYSKTCLKRPLKKEDQLSLNAVQKYSAIISTFIKLPFILSACLRHVLLYWQPTCTFCFVEFVDSL